jgi:hypothetical protein
LSIRNWVTIGIKKGNPIICGIVFIPFDGHCDSTLVIAEFCEEDAFSLFKSNWAAY